MPLRNRAADLVAVGIAACAAALLAAASIYRHGRFGSNAYDLGLFDQTIWGYSRFDALPNTIVRLPNLLGDHFHPILVVLAPLYWVWDDVRVLLVAQAMLLAAGAIPLFLWARSELGTFAALLFEVAYLAFWALVGGSLFDFHEVAFAAPVLALGVYAAVTGRMPLLVAAVALGLLTREDLALTLAALVLYVAVARRRWPLGLALAATCVAWFALMIKVVIPSFADRDYTHWWYDALGDGPLDALTHLFLHPLDSARIFFTPFEKRLALFNLFAPWLFLPLLSPLVLVTLPGLAARFFSEKPSHWAPQGFHYSLVIAPILAFAAVDTTRRVAARFGRTLALTLAALVMLATLYFTFVRLRPLDELRRYATDAQVAAIEECLETIPPDASVAATSALVPHLSHRREIYVIDQRRLPQATYYAIDRATWHFPLDNAELSRIARRLRARGYDTVCEREATTVLARP